MRVFKIRPVWTSPPRSFARALELGTACSIDAKPSATRERCSSGSTTGAGLSPLTAKSESGKGDAHRLAPQALGVSKDAVQAWLPELHAWLLKRGSPSCTLGCSWSRCIRPWMRQRPRPMKLDETHKKKKQQTVNAPPCRQHGWHGRQKNGLRKNGWRRRNKQRLGRRKKLSCRECSQPAAAAPRQAKRKSQAEKNEARNKRRRELRQEARQSQDPEARGKIGKARTVRCKMVEEPIFSTRTTIE